jgi:hypothetical protein
VEVIFVTENHELSTGLLEREVFFNWQALLFTTILLLRRGTRKFSPIYWRHFT